MPSFRLPLAVALGALACWLTLAVTDPPGPGLDPDAVSYISAARSLVSNGTLTVPDDGWDSPDSTTPLAHFPPGLPVVLAVPIAAGLPPLQSARLVNGIAALIMMTLTAWLVSRATGRRALGVMAAVLVMATPAISDQFQNVLSEPAFLALLAAMLAMMVLRRDSPLAAGVVAAAAAMVRYAGAAFIGAVGVWWLLQPGGRGRVRRAAIAVLPGTVAGIAWVARILHVSRAREIRQLSVYGQIMSTLREGLGTTATWLAPLLDGVPRALVAVGVGGAVAWLIVRASRAMRGRARGRAERGADDALVGRLTAAALVVAVCYVGFVVASRLFADPSIPLDARLLSPVLFLCTIAVSAAVGVLWHSWSRRARAAVCAVIGAWCVASGVSAVSDGLDALDYGNDFAGMQWSGSPLAAWVRDSAAGRTVYTNFPTALYFHADRWARELPRSTSPDTIAALESRMTDDHGVMVVFHQTSAFVPAPDSLLARLPLRELVRTHDGAVYELAH